VQVLRGLFLGLFWFVGFDVALAALLPRTGLLLAFAVVPTVALSIHASTLRPLRRGRGAPPETVV
jgi:hypothetical protein